MGNLAHISATASLNIDPFQQSTRVLQAQARALDRTLRTTELSFKNSGKSINSLKSIYNTTGKAVESYTQLLNKQQKEYDAYKSKIGDVNTATDAELNTLMRKEQAIQRTSAKLEILNGKYAALTKQVAMSENKFANIGKKLNETGDKLENIGSKMESFGGKATKSLTVPIALGAAAAVKAASSYESAFAGVRKTVDASEQDFKRLSDGIREMAKTMPQSATEIAEVAEAAGQLGIHTDNILSFTETMVDMGVATNLSSDEAATSLARFANIMDMNQDKFSNLGSSIVELGNNFATTESEITQMSLRLAGVGKQIGMSESDVMGLAAAMSTVGIEAEAGGSSMTQALKRMQNAVSGGTKELQSFAKVAGVTGEEFSKMFTDDPARALQAYVEGLEAASKNGENLNGILSEVGITGTREADTMLRLAGNSKVLGEALDTSGKAWEENTALSEEAAVRYETLESKLQMFKNQLVDIGIEVGGPFVDAMRSALTASEPFLKTISDMAKKFSEANPQTQQAIIKTLAFAAAIGPAAKVLGMFTGILGKGAKGLGGLAIKLAESQVKAQLAKGGFEAASAGATAVGTSSAVAGKGVLAATKGFALAHPVVLGVTAALVAGVAVWELWGKKALQSAKETSRWGSSVGKDTDEALTKFQGFSRESQQAMSDFENGATQSTESIKTSFNNMFDEIKTGAEKSNQEIQKNLEKLPIEIQKSVEKAAEKQQEKNNKSVEIAKTATDQIVGIYEKHNGDVTKLSEDEKQIVIGNQRILNQERVRLLGLSKAKEKSILAALNGDINKMTAEQRDTAISDLRVFHNEQEKEYEKNKERLAKVLGKGTPEYKKALEELTTLHKSATDDIARNTIELAEANGVSNRTMIAMLQSLGYSYEDASKFISNYSEKSSESLSILANNTEKTSQKASEANQKWNSLVFDEKTGKVKTNAKEEVQKAIESEDGWDNIKFIAKNANLNSNAKQVIFDAIQDSGKWNDLEIDPKILKADNVDFLVKLTETSGALELFNGMPVEVKKLLIDGTEKMNADEARIALEQYDSLNPQLKQLLIDNFDATSKTTDAQYKLENYERINPQTKILRGNNSDANSKVDSTREKLLGYNRVPTPKKVLTADSSNAVSNANAAADAINRVPARKTSVLSLITEKITRIFKHKKGTKFHPGGDAILGDGGKQEPFLTPSGFFGISPATDTLIPDLERGTKVWSSIEKFKREMPHYKNGTDFFDTKGFNAINNVRLPQEPQSNRYDDSLPKKLDKLILLLEEQKNNPPIVQANGVVMLEDKRVVGQWVAGEVEKQIDKNNARKARMRGDI